MQNGQIFLTLVTHSSSKLCRGSQLVNFLFHSKDDFLYLTDVPRVHPFQVVIVGNGAVGKSSMIQKYCKGIFTAEYKKTIGVDFLEKRIW